MARICPGEVCVRSRIGLSPRSGRLHVERILHLAGRVMRREIQQLEIQFVGLDLRRGVDLKAHLGQNGQDAAQLLRGRMQAAAADGASGQGHIQPRVRERAVPGDALPDVLRACRPARPRAQALRRLAACPKAGRSSLESVGSPAKTFIKVANCVPDG